MRDVPNLPPSRDVAYHLGLFQTKIEGVAERAGVSAYDRLSLETMLAALPWPERRRVGLILKGAKAQSDSAAVHHAVEMLLSLASKVWGEAEGASSPQGATPELRWAPREFGTFGLTNSSDRCGC